MKVLAFFFSLFMVYHPSPTFECDGDLLKATIRNNINGDFVVTDDLEKIDKGAFVLLDWRENVIMLPISFNAGEITFTDKTWLWSYQNNKNGLIAETPRFAHRLPNGNIKEFTCESKI